KWPQKKGRWRREIDCFRNLAINSPLYGLHLVLAPMSEPDSFGFGLFKVRVSQRELLKEGRRLHPPERVFNLLLALLRNHKSATANHVVHEALWPNSKDDVTVLDKRLTDVYGRLCDLLDDTDSTARKYIGREGGYFRFLVEVKEDWDRRSEASSKQ